MEAIGSFFQKFVFVFILKGRERNIIVEKLQYPLNHGVSHKFPCAWKLLLRLDPGPQRLLCVSSCAGTSRRQGDPACNIYDLAETTF